MRSILTSAVIAAVLCGVAGPAAAAEPVVSVWYRGQPAGTPRLDDLAAIRALGLTGITWPSKWSAALPEVKRLAGIVGLAVVVADRAQPVTPISALAPADRADLIVTPGTEPILAALAWRAVAHGARSISYDGGEATGAGLTEADGRLRPWAHAAIALARQLSANATLADVLRPGPVVAVDPPLQPGFDLVLLDGGRSWVVAATNTSAETRRGTASLPADVPYAIWVSWFDGRTLAMLGTPAGPRWNFSLAPGEAQVFIIDKR